MAATLLALILVALVASGSAQEHNHNHGHEGHEGHDAQEATTTVIPLIQCTSEVVCVEQLGPNADCFGGQCQCSNGSDFNVEEGKCIEPITSFRSGQSCTSDRDCKMIESKCRDRQCKCEPNFIESLDRSKCLPLANEVGWGCEEDLQCTTKLNKTTECRDFSCSCRPGTAINHLGACVESKGLDAYCQNSDVCLTPNSECVQAVCACKHGFVPAADSQRCLEVAQGFKSPCEESIQCSETFGLSSVCQKSECICKTGYHFSDMQCWQDAGLSDRCDRPDECYIAADGSNQKLQCIAGQCICKPEYKPDFGTKRCTGGASQMSISGVLAILIAAVLAA